MVKIRLSKVGRTHAPIWRIIAVDSRKKRDGAVIANLGTYDARQTKLVQFKPELFNEWIQKGAQPSDTVKKIYRLYKKQEAGHTPVQTEKEAQAKPVASQEKVAAQEAPSTPEKASAPEESSASKADMPSSDKAE